jgi:hypothetical protein
MNAFCRSFLTPAVTAAVIFLFAGGVHVASADQVAGTASADPSTGVITLLSAADTDMSTALNDVLANDPLALNFALCVTSADNGGGTCGAQTGQTSCLVLIVPALGQGMPFVQPEQGHYTITPSGNVVLSCHGRGPSHPPPAEQMSGFLCYVPAPPGFQQAVPGYVATMDSHTVWTPSGEVNAVCHFHPNG